MRRPEAWVRDCPDKPAVVDGERTLTWREWNSAADRLADWLDRTVPDNPVAAVYLHSRVEWFVVNLALAKLDRQQVAVNWRLSVSEVRHVLADSGAGVLFLDAPDPLAGARLCEGLDTLAVPLRGDGAGVDLPTAIRLGRDTPRVSTGRARPVIYTSGTTGRPKGVVKANGRDDTAPPAVLAYLAARRRRYPATADNRTLVSLPLHHGAGEGQAQRALAAGGTVYLMDRFDPEGALELIQRHRITEWSTVPTMLFRLRALPAEVLERYDVSSLERVGVGGASVPYALKDWAIDFFGEGRLHEAYGATEVGTITSMPPHLHREKPYSCGKALDLVELRVVDRQGNTVPAGTEGELQVRTPLTIDRYVGGPELGGDDLTEDGFFRVGDLGRLDEDGFLYVTGRAKDMVVSGGVNIYPAEVEQALRECPGVVDAAVVGVPDEEMGELVVAYCEVGPGSDLTREALLEHAAERLAAFKLPRRVHLVPELPRNAMLKVVKNTLRAWAAEEPESAR
ncbi:putative acyl-CoA synthetase [Actinacidiphila reveromycinica]|uniref:Putative acyl-CoA synthetase n=2 Tax=Actinacidiphila reveromycinica TaxID=659352 RepID=A0A7U3VSH4_9ACTN|nr:putative acyl-CoA synthetase [Streptomyces sp. SN-593]